MVRQLLESQTDITFPLVTTKVHITTWRGTLLTKVISIGLSIYGLVPNRKSEHDRFQNLKATGRLAAKAVRHDEHG